MATKKRAAGESDKPVKGTGAGKAGSAKRAAGRVGAATVAKKRAVAPRIRASHAGVAEPLPSGEGGARKRAPRPGERPARPIRADRTSARARDITPRSAGSASPKAPLSAPKRPSGKRALAPAAPQPSPEARELALALAGAGLDKKAIGIEILDVTGRVDYADYLVIMTGRSDRHVHAIATGLEEALRTKKKTAPLSMEGLTAATWVLIDFGDVVVHVFQEEARRLYDIEGLWIDAGRVPVEGGAEGERASPPGAATVTRVLPG